MKENGWFGYRIQRFTRAAHLALGKIVGAPDICKNN